MALATGLSAATVAATPAPASATACSIGQPGSDYAADVASSALAARTWRLYQAFFLRQPDQAGLGYWLGQARAGVSLGAMAWNFERSDEFAARYGPLDNAGFVTLIYANVLCRTPDPDGFGYWVDLLDRGVVNRGGVMILFSESAEFGLATGTRWSSYADPAAATLADDGYQLVPIPGGEAVQVDYSRVDFGAGHGRCSVASINGNWFSPERAAHPVPVGFAVIDGQQVAGSEERDDRGVLGERYRPGGPDSERVWVYQGTFNLNSNLAAKAGRELESWASWQPPDTPPLDQAAEWRWAAAGVPLVVNGQVWSGFADIPTTDRTFYSAKHSFVAFDKGTGTLLFGATTAMNAAQLIDWALANGYDDLVKFDGGGSVELNLNGAPRVAGTARNVPLWLGIGC